MWRCMMKLHDNVEFSLMEAGHTKFHPDWHFGLWKVMFRELFSIFCLFKLYFCYKIAKQIISTYTIITLLGEWKHVCGLYFGRKPEYLAKTHLSGLVTMLNDCFLGN